MKLAIFVIVGSLCIGYGSSVRETFWGYNHHKAIGTFRVFADPSGSNIQNKTFTFSNKVFFFIFNELWNWF